MKVENIDIEQTLRNAKDQLASNKDLSPAIKSLIEMLILIISIFCNRLNLNSRNSSKPPSQDPNRAKKFKKRRGKKPGGQNGHPGSTLEKIEDPDEIIDIPIDRRALPPGKYKKVGYDSRQVFGFEIKRKVVEYRAEILEDKKRNRYISEFPDDVKVAAQYGVEVKSESVYFSQFQLIPLARIKDHFDFQLGLPVSKGSISSFNLEAYKRLEKFEIWVKEKLLDSPVDHVDETGININGIRMWLHTICNDKYTLFHPDPKRGQEAIERMGMLPHYQGILCHDHWQSYFFYNCLHSLCNAHHLRELEFAWTEEGQKWAKSMKSLLEEANKAVNKSNGKLSKTRVEQYIKKYRSIIKRGKKECPIPPKVKGKRGRQKKSKSRNLLERLEEYEEETLRFMKDELVPFTNNQGENDLRMTKVQQKISGCFRSMEGAKIFCRIRSYLNTARKNGLEPTKALTCLFKGETPEFMR